MKRQPIEYSSHKKITAVEFVDLLKRSTLDQRRPVKDPVRIQKMLDYGSILVTAWSRDTLVGVSRALSDFSFCCYLSDLAVDKACQGQGIGKRLIEETRTAAGGPSTTTLLLSAPTALSFYQGIKMPQADNCFLYRRAR